LIIVLLFSIYAFKAGLNRLLLRMISSRRLLFWQMSFILRLTPPLECRRHRSIGRRVVAWVVDALYFQGALCPAGGIGDFLRMPNASQVPFESFCCNFPRPVRTRFSVGFAGAWLSIPSAISSPRSTGRIRGCAGRRKEYIQRMVATDMIEQIRQLPNREAVRLYEYLFSEASELDRLLAAFDRLPRKTRLTEKEILHLPRARPARQ
jgi:hypothetical protein